VAFIQIAKGTTTLSLTLEIEYYFILGHTKTKYFY